MFKNIKFKPSPISIPPWSDSNSRKIRKSNEYTT